MRSGAGSRRVKPHLDAGRGRWNPRSRLSPAVVRRRHSRGTASLPLCTKPCIFAGDPIRRPALPSSTSGLATHRWRCCNRQKEKPLAA